MNISSDILSYVSCDNGIVIPNASEIQTVIYDKPYIVSCLENNIKPDPISSVLSTVSSI